MAKIYQNRVTIAPITITVGQSIPVPTVTEAVAPVTNTSKGVQAATFVILASSADALPAGITAEWVNPAQLEADAQMLGSHSEDVRFTFPDGSTLVKTIPNVLVVNKERAQNPSTSGNGQSSATHPTNPAAPSNTNNDAAQTSTPSTNEGTHSSSQTTTLNQANTHTVTKNAVATKTVAAHQFIRHSQHKQALPQTGNETSSAVIALGALTAMLGLGLAKKREF